MDILITFQAKTKCRRRQLDGLLNKSCFGKCQLFAIASYRCLQPRPSVCYSSPTSTRSSKCNCYNNVSYFSKKQQENFQDGCRISEPNLTFTFPRIQNQLRLLVAAADGYLYIYNLDPNEGGDLTLVKQHRLDGRSDPLPTTAAASSPSPAANTSVDRTDSKSKPQEPGNIK